MSKLVITDALVRETTQFPSLAYMSPSGDRIYAVYEILAEEGIRLAAELFAVEDGKLVSLATYENDLEFVAVDGGAASHDFTRFSIIEDNQNGQFRVRLLRYVDKMLIVVGERILDAYTPGFTPFGGTFLEDDSAIVVTAVTKNTQPNQTSTIWLLANNHSLSILDSHTDQVIYTTIAAPFAEKNQQHFAITTSKGILDFNDIPSFAAAPHRLVIYKIEKHQLVPTKKADLPQVASSVGAFHRSDKTLISVSTYMALPESGPTIPIRTETNITTTNNDDEFRIYGYSGKELRLVLSQNTDTTVESIYLANNDIVWFSQNTGPYPEFLPSVVQWGSWEKDCDKLDDLSLAKPTNGFANVVTDSSGRLVLIYTASGTNNHNLILAKLIC